MEDINLDKNEIEQIKTEQLEIHIFSQNESKTYSANRISGKVKDRYKFSNYLIDPNRYRFRKVIRVMAFVLMFIKKASKNIKVQSSQIFNHTYPGEISEIIKPSGDRFVLTTGRVRNMTFECPVGNVVELTIDFLKFAMFYYFWKSTKHFVEKKGI